MTKRFLQNRAAVFTSALILVVACIGIFAPIIAPNDPYETNIINKFAEYSLQYPLGTDQLGRCVLSRMIYGCLLYTSFASFIVLRSSVM